MTYNTKYSNNLESESIYGTNTGNSTAKGEHNTQDYIDLLCLETYSKSRLNTQTKTRFETTQDYSIQKDMNTTMQVKLPKTHSSS